MNYLSYLVLKFIYILAKVVPLRYLYYVTGLISVISFFFMRLFNTRRYKIGMESMMLSGYPKRKSRMMFKKVLHNFAKTGLEMLCLKRMKHDFIDKNVTIVHEERLQVLHNSNKPIILLGAHIGNWEIINRYIANKEGKKAAAFYRPCNNKHIDELITNCRNVPHIPKYKTGIKQLISSLKRKEPVAVLLDQRNRRGQIMKFLGRDALTSTALEKIFIKYDAVLLPIVCTRTKGNKFVMTIEKPINSEHFKGEKGEVDLANTILKQYEKWINLYPNQWFWIHDRWKI